MIVNLTPEDMQNEVVDDVSYVSRSIESITFIGFLPLDTTDVNKVRLGDVNGYRHLIAIEWTHSVNWIVAHVIVDPRIGMHSHTSANMRVFVGVSMCNNKDIYDVKTGLRQAVRDALNIGGNALPGYPKYKNYMDRLYRNCRAAIKLVNLTAPSEGNSPTVGKITRIQGE